jgi:REP element-mobilizing transposase RayT
MTAPRQLLPGTTYLVTRRCVQRQFLLRPTAVTSAVFGYVLAVAAQRYGVRLHAFCVMSNHVHLVLTDPDARLPAFKQYLDGLVARALNAAQGHWESFWAPGSYSAVALQAPEDVVDKVAYVLANPVTAGLAERPEDWQGLRSSPEAIGGATLEFPRPGTFFRAQGPMPARAGLQVTAPSGFASPGEFRAALDAALRDHVARGERKRPRSPEPSKGRPGAPVRSRAAPVTREPRRGLRPRVAALDRSRRLEALHRLAVFLEDYRKAWRSRGAGALETVFPAGTYLLRVLHQAPCAAAAPS